MQQSAAIVVQQTARISGLFFTSQVSFPPRRSKHLTGMLARECLSKHAHLHLPFVRSPPNEGGTRGARCVPLPDARFPRACLSSVEVVEASYVLAGDLAAHARRDCGEVLVEHALRLGPDAVGVRV